MSRTKSFDEIMELRVDKEPQGCWMWTGARAMGYGRLTHDKRNYSAHKWVWEYMRGAIPEELDLGHLCGNRACVNPEHLQPMTRAAALLKGKNPRREQTHCLRGHELASENLYLPRQPAAGGGTKLPGRQCKQCVIEGNKRRRAG